MNDAADRDRIEVTYEFGVGAGGSARDTARTIALEQTVELPEKCYPARIEDEVVGRVERVERAAGGRHRATISYQAGLVGQGVPQLLNLMFGNVSLKPDVRVVALDLPDAVLAWLGGPRFGIAGIRRACPHAAGRALVCSAAKPVGLTVEELAARCAALARGGIDVIKDDHGVADQASAPFAERVARCQEAVRRANAETGGGALYFPHVSAPLTGLEGRLETVRALGCRGVLVSPFVMGLDTLRWLAEASDLILLAHPTFAGSLTHPDHGIAPPVLFGRLLRVLGSDAVIYLNPRGRFPIPDAEGDAITASLREPLGSVRPALPVPGGGVDAARVPAWIDRYGPDTMFLVGSSLYAQADLEKAARDLMGSVRWHGHG